MSGARPAPCREESTSGGDRHPAFAGGGRPTSTLAGWRDRLATDPLGPIRARATERSGAARRARRRTGRFVAKRGPDGAWRAPHLRRGAGPGRGASAARSSRAGSRPSGRSSILSGNDLDHAVLALARHACRRALRAGLAGLCHDRRRLRAAKDVLALADAGARLRGRCGGLRPGDRRRRAARRRRSCSAEARCRARGLRPSPSFEARATTGGARARRTRRSAPDTVAKFLFTSGSTGLPKARDHHAPHALRQPSPDRRRRSRSSPTSRRCSSTGCPGTTSSAATTTSTSCSSTAARSTSTTAGRRRR